MKRGRGGEKIQFGLREKKGKRWPLAHLRGILLLAHPVGWCSQVLRYPQTSSAREIPNLTRPDPCAPGDPRPPGAQMSAAAKNPEGSGLDTPSPLNVKGKRGPLQNGRCGQDRSPGPQLAPASARHPTLPGAEPREGPWLPTLSPSPCPRILPPPPRPSAPTSGDAVVQAAEMGGRGQECALPRGRPPPGRTGDLGRPLLLQTSGIRSLGPHLQGALPAVPRPRRSPGQSTGYLRCPQAACAFRPGVPAWMRSDSRLPPPAQTPRSKVTGCPLGDHGSRGG